MRFHGQNISIIFGPDQVLGEKKGLHGQNFSDVFGPDGPRARKKIPRPKLLALVTARVALATAKKNLTSHGQKKLTAKKYHGSYDVPRFHGQKSKSNVISRPKKLSITPHASAHAHTGARSIESRNARHTGA